MHSKSIQYPQIIYTFMGFRLGGDGCHRCLVSAVGRTHQIDPHRMNQVPPLPQPEHVRLRQTLGQGHGQEDTLQRFDRWDSSLSGCFPTTLTNITHKRHGGIRYWRTCCEYPVVLWVEMENKHTCRVEQGCRSISHMQQILESCCEGM